jgi:hypothetical protein
VKIKTYLTITDLDKNGKPFGKPVTRQCHSFVQHFADILYTNLSTLALTSCLDIFDAGRTISWALFPMNAAANTDSYGIQVGTGTNPVSMNDTKLQTRILQSTTGEPGKMVYSVQTWTAPSTNGSTRSFKVSRTFTNNSGATINIGEIGMVFLQNSYSFLFERTLFSKTVLNGNGTTVTYTISITV